MYRHILGSDKRQVLVISTDHVNPGQCTHPDCVAIFDIHGESRHFFRWQQFAQVLVCLHMGTYLADVRNAWSVNHSEANIELLDC